MATNNEMSPEVLKEMLATVLSENPTLCDSEKNGRLVGEFLDEHGCEINLENIRKAVLILGYPNDKLERQKPPAPLPPPAPPEPDIPAEVLAPGEISIYSDSWTLKNSTPQQIRSYLTRLRAAAKK
jgi:hypothetical protein